VTDDAYFRDLVAALSRSDAVEPADGLPVTVTGVRVSGHGETQELVIEFSVPGLPSGECRQPYDEEWRRRFRPADATTYAAQLSDEIQAWAIGHVRKVHPPEPMDRDRVREELPPRDELWRSLTAEFADVTAEPGQGFRGRNRFGSVLTIALTPEEWQDYVVSCEIGCRLDYGVDAEGEGDGLLVAVDDLDETMATMDPDETFVVLDGGQLTGSTRAELPPEAGTGSAREHEKVMRRITNARKKYPDPPFGWLS
jgi:hypothetical protein